jgi:hypothetical protein
VRRALAVLAVAAVTAGAGGACGGGEGGPLARAEDAMAELEAGRLDLRFASSAGGDGGAGPVGFRMEGPFSMEGGALPVLDLRYTRLLGDRESVIRVVSTGEEAFVVADDRTVEVPPEDADRLRLGDGDGGIADLGIAGWARDPEVEERDGGVRVVRGGVDVADLLSDLARIGAQAGGGGRGERLDDDAAARLRTMARSSEFVAELGPDDLPRSLRAVVDFGGRVPDEVREALGPYASARLELTLSLERLRSPLDVEAPTGSR